MLAKWHYYGSGYRLMLVYDAWGPCLRIRSRRMMKTGAVFALQIVSNRLLRVVELDSRIEWISKTKTQWLRLPSRFTPEVVDRMYFMLQLEEEKK